MNSCITCKEAIEHCMSTHTFAFAHLYGDEKIMDMHIHNCCEVYYSISGGKQFLIDHCLYDIRPGDLFLINQFESHHLTQIDQQTHERIILSIDPEYLSKLSTGVTNLGHCFSFRDTRMPHQIHLSPKEQNRFMYFIHELHDDGGMGEDLLDQAIFLELMVFLNRAADARRSVRAFFYEHVLSVPYFQGGHRHHHQQIHHRKAHHPVQIAARSGLLRLGSLRGLRLQRLQQLSACLHKSSRHLSEKVRAVSLLTGYICSFCSTSLINFSISLFTSSGWSVLEL